MGQNARSLSMHFFDMANANLKGFFSTFSQFFRIHFQIRKWTRQKVFHAMVAVANFGERHFLI